MSEYTLILAEKKEAAERIARALDEEGRPKKMDEGGVPYFEAAHDGKRLVVVSAIGHLYTVAPERKGRFYYPVFNVRWTPTHLVNRKATRTRRWVEAISKLSEGASEFISGTDYDIEGEVIGYTILKHACGGKEGSAKRMKFSTLTEAELKDAYDNLSPTIDFHLADAGETRHIVDFLWGVNLSRALTLAAKRWSKRYATLSAGRVQAPTLRFLVEREEEIRTFVPIPYWEIRAQVEIDGTVYDVTYERDKIHRKAEAEAIVGECSGKDGVVEGIDVRKFRQAAPVPFKLGTLQSEAYRFFGFTPSRTLRLAERLYLSALISYPRTSSEKIPPTIDCRAILSSLSRERAYKELAGDLLARKRLKPKEGKGEDPAHPAIYATGTLPERGLDASQRKVFDLVVRRFMASFGSPAIKEGVKATIKIGDHRFYLHGRRVLREGWLRFYGPYARTKEVLLPPLKERQRLTFKEIAYEDKFTKPPPRYNPSSLLKKMDGEGIGTKATRADIIDTLYSRGYVRGERMMASELGMSVVQTLGGYCPQIISVEFTRKLEEEMEMIERGEGRKEDVLVEAVGRLKPILEKLKFLEEEIGRELSEGVRKARLEERIIGPCPTCKTGNLIILFSRRTGKRFAGCTNFSRGLCTTSFPLPQPPHSVKPTGNTCKACGYPMVRVRSRGRRPWNLCLNPDCPRKEDYRRRRDEVRSLRKKG
ncbi:MAG: DNA topoisomerase I [Candidatus Bathyarchaeia archaeon]